MCFTCRDVPEPKLTFTLKGKEDTYLFEKNTYTVNLTQQTE